MILNNYFIDYHVKGYLSRGPLVVLLDGFCQWLETMRFSRGTIRLHISQVSVFSDFLGQISLADYTELSQEHFELFFDDYLPNSTNKRGNPFNSKAISWSINRFKQYFHTKGLSENLKDKDAPYKKLLDEYLNWLENYKGLSPGTIKIRKQYLSFFLEWFYKSIESKELSALSPTQVTDYFIDFGATRGPSARRSMQATLRTFFCFCTQKGYITHNLDQAVPTMRTYKLSHTPRGIVDKEAQRLLNDIDRGTKSGCRNYAMIQMLYSYGVRGGQVRALRLQDINWLKNQIRFPGLKGGKDSLLPIIDPVGESLLDYLQNVRPNMPFKEVFLTLRAPYKALQKSSVLSESIRTLIRRHKIKSPSGGSHLFRHSFAIRMLKRGHSIKSIADIFGHKHIQTTFIYTKVDFKTLEKVALDWLETER